MLKRAHLLTPPNARQAGTPISLTTWAFPVRAGSRLNFVKVSTKSKLPLLMVLWPSDAGEFFWKDRKRRAAFKEAGLTGSRLHGALVKSSPVTPELSVSGPKPGGCYAQGMGTERSCGCGRENGFISAARKPHLTAQPLLAIDFSRREGEQI